MCQAIFLKVVIPSGCILHQHLAVRSSAKYLHAFLQLIALSIFRVSIRTAHNSIPRVVFQRMVLLKNGPCSRTILVPSVRRCNGKLHKTRSSVFKSHV